jgi:hypothetical protein
MTPTSGSRTTPVTRVLAARSLRRSAPPGTRQSKATPLRGAPYRRIDMKKYLLILGISAIHYIISILVLANGVANSINRLAVNYKPLPPTAFEHFLPHVVFFPGSLIKSTFADDVSLLIWIGINSLLWGMSIYWIGGLLFRRVRSKRGQKLA